LHLVQGSPSLDRPVAEQAGQILSPSFEGVLPFPPHTIHETLDPSGFIPVPEQKTHFRPGSSTSTIPVPLHTKQNDDFASNSKQSFPVPLQYAHIIFIPIITTFYLWFLGNRHGQLLIFSHRPIAF